MLPLIEHARELSPVVKPQSENILGVTGLLLESFPRKAWCEQDCGRETSVHICLRAV
jgi:hypothetical protein